eukprot:gnl/MRDRNA2_/MRDRNA2_146754_c0_seq1.p1 gnl/MRDRNA2_/MRDRNA2_146754_c0~~gnl/MRDRNA2_/MRDRNA2_146754_c0_seq1.p1  ORF type:complete len:387 (+),score=45.54 gnl/MRDRNA2_/MRDRNA2_146754_c0_seq1:80-1162(+)
MHGPGYHSYGGSHGGYGGSYSGTYGSYANAGPQHGGFGDFNYGSHGAGYGDPYRYEDVPVPGGQRSEHGLNSSHAVTSDPPMGHHSSQNQYHHNVHPAMELGGPSDSRWMELLGPAGGGAMSQNQGGMTQRSDAVSFRGLSPMERSRPRAPGCDPISEMPPADLQGLPENRGGVGLPQAGSFVATPFDDAGAPLYYQNHNSHWQQQQQHGHGHYIPSSQGGPPMPGYHHHHLHSHGFGGPGGPPPAGYGPLPTGPPPPGPICAPPIGVMPLNLRFDEDKKKERKREESFYNAPNTPVSYEINKKPPFPKKGHQGEVINSEEVLDSECGSEIGSPQPRPPPRVLKRRGKHRPNCAPCFAGC